ncbi:MAG: hypothetical protein LBR53_12325 [Deltaproteobacteria bacterium]|jgi:hypothetical protein|nr:hypothetical protein [Deltaproteobacteria bacterium]
MAKKKKYQKEFKMAKILKSLLDEEKIPVSKKSFPDPYSLGQNDDSSDVLKPFDDPFFDEEEEFSKGVRFTTNPALDEEFLNERPPVEDLDIQTWNVGFDALFFGASTHMFNINLRRPEINFVKNSSDWAEYDAKNRKFFISEELVTKHPWYVVECFGLHEFLHYFMDIRVKINGYGYDKNGHHTQKFKKIGKQMLIPDFYLTDTVEKKILTPDPVGPTLPPPSSAGLELIRRARSILLDVNLRGVDEISLGLIDIAKLMGSRHLELLKKPTYRKDYGYMLVPSEYLETIEMLGPINQLLRNHFFVFPFIYGLFDQFYCFPDWATHIFGRSEFVIISAMIHNFLKKKLILRHILKESKFKSVPPEVHVFKENFIDEITLKMEKAAKTPENLVFSKGTNYFSASSARMDKIFEDGLNDRAPYLSIQKTEDLTFM